ncbi:MAG: hypothetical protein AAGD25_30495 [Cyanobacteria bacterium P01_F01_bin.150]
MFTKKKRRKRKEKDNSPINKDKLKSTTSITSHDPIRTIDNHQRQKQRRQDVKDKNVLSDQRRHFDTSPKKKGDKNRNVDVSNKSIIALEKKFLGAFLKSSNSTKKVDANRDRQQKQEISNFQKGDVFDPKLSIKGKYNLQSPEWQKLTGWIGKPKVTFATGEAAKRKKQLFDDLEKLYNTVNKDKELTEQQRVWRFPPMTLKVKRNGDTEGSVSLEQKADRASWFPDAFGKKSPAPEQAKQDVAIRQKLIEHTLELIGESGYLGHLTTLNGKEDIEVSVDYYHDRSIDSRALHMDTQGYTRFVTLSYHNPDRVLKGPEISPVIRLKPEIVKQMESVWGQARVKQYKDLVNRQKGKTNEDKRELLIIPKNGALHWADYAMFHATPLDGQRMMKKNDLIALMNKEAFITRLKTVSSIPDDIEKLRDSNLELSEKQKILQEYSDHPWLSSSRREQFKKLISSSKGPNPSDDFQQFVNMETAAKSLEEDLTEAQQDLKDLVRKGPSNDDFDEKTKQWRIAQMLRNKYEVGANLILAGTLNTDHGTGRVKVAGTTVGVPRNPLLKRKESDNAIQNRNIQQLRASLNPGLVAKNNELPDNESLPARRFIRLWIKVRKKTQEST